MNQDDIKQDKSGLNMFDCRCLIWMHITLRKNQLILMHFIINETSKCLHMM